MAKRLMGKIQTFLGLAGLVALGVSASLITGINPLDYADDVLAGVAEKLKGKLTEPSPDWSDRVDGPPVAAAVTADRVVVVLNGAVEARRLSDGGPAWHRVVDWAVPAGDVVVAGRASGGGFEVLDASTGRVRWDDPEAQQAWPYRDKVLSLRCRDDGDGCTLRARSTADGSSLWRRDVDPAAQRLAGYRDLDEAVDRAGMLTPDHPGTAPRLVGVVAERRVTVVDTGSGAVTGEVTEGRDSRVTVWGDRVLRVSIRTARGGGCHYTVRASKPGGGDAWRRTDVDLGTVSGSGCEQRRDPRLAGDVLVGVTRDNRPCLVGVAGGAVRWTGGRGDTVLATDGRVAVVRTRGSDRVTAVDTATGDPLWNTTAPRGATVVVTEHAVLVADPEAGVIEALSPRDGSAMATWTSAATLIGSDAHGILVRNGRTVGYARW